MPQTEIHDHPTKSLCDGEDEDCRVVMANGNYVLTRQLTEQEQVDTKLTAATAWSARTHQEEIVCLVKKPTVNATNSQRARHA